MRLRARTFDQALEIRRRTHRHVVVPRRQPRHSIFAQVVGALRARLLPPAAPANKRLPQHRHLRVGQRVSIFIGHASAHHRRRLQPNPQILDFLPCRQSQHTSISPDPVLVNFEQPRAFREEMVTPRQNAFDVKPSVRPADRRVVSAFRLILGNQFDQSFLHWLAARFLRDHALNHGAAPRFRPRTARDLRRCVHTRQSDRQTGDQRRQKQRDETWILAVCRHGFNWKGPGSKLPNRPGGSASNSSHSTPVGSFPQALSQTGSWSKLNAAPARPCHPKGARSAPEGPYETRAALVETRGPPAPQEARAVLSTASISSADVRSLARLSPASG